VVRFEAGFGAAEEVPDDLQEAVLRLVGAIYRARPGDGSIATSDIGVPAEVQAILNARKEVRL
jgi:hypothetical protein